MDIIKKLHIDSVEDWRKWLEENHNVEKEIWLITCKDKNGVFTIDYIETVEEALCFGWIDSTRKKIDEQHNAQRFTPRRKNGNWTELNKERARRLIRLGKMTNVGLQSLPDLDKPFIIEKEIIERIKQDEEVYKNFLQLPELYIRIKMDNIQPLKDETLKEKRLNKFIEYTRKNQLYGVWNDKGKLNTYNCENENE